MTFFDYPIYDIPEPGEVTEIGTDLPIIVLVQKDAYGEAEEVLLSKILKAVHQEFSKVHIVKCGEDDSYKVANDENERLIILFGIEPAVCGQQVDSGRYSLVKRKKNTFLFSNSLPTLPNLPEERRALWVILKKYFKLD